MTEPMFNLEGLERKAGRKLFRIFSEISGDNAQEIEIALRYAGEAIRQGADVNARGSSSELGMPERYLLGAVLEELVWQTGARAAALKLFLAHGFDPGRGGGLNGAQALTNLIKHCYADEGILEGMKALLQAGADPELAFSVEGESVNAWQAAREGLAMAFFRFLDGGDRWLCPGLLLPRQVQGRGGLSVGELLLACRRPADRAGERLGRYRH